MTLEPYEETDDYEPETTDWNDILAGFSQGGVAGIVLGIILGILFFI